MSVDMKAIISKLKDLERKLDEQMMFSNVRPEDAVEYHIEDVVIHILRCYMYGDETQSWNYWISKEIVAYLLPILRSRKSSKHPTGDKIYQLMVNRLPVVFDDCYEKAQDEKEGKIINPDAFSSKRCYEFTVEVLTLLFKGKGNMNAYISFNDVASALKSAGAKEFYGTSDLKKKRKR